MCKPNTREQFTPSRPSPFTPTPPHPQPNLVELTVSRKCGPQPRVKIPISKLKTDVRFIKQPCAATQCSPTVSGRVGERWVWQGSGRLRVRSGGWWPRTDRRSSLVAHGTMGPEGGETAARGHGGWPQPETDTDTEMVQVQVLAPTSRKIAEVWLQWCECKQPRTHRHPPQSERQRYVCVVCVCVWGVWVCGVLVCGCASIHIHTHLSYSAGCLLRHDERCPRS
jgi:hypothetical protein